MIRMNEVISVFMIDILIIYTGVLSNSGLEQFYFGFAFLGLLGLKVITNMFYIWIKMFQSGKLIYKAYENVQIAKLLKK